ncbi:MAG: hypothetical protein ACK5O8_06960 [Pirellula sp.]
MKNSCHQQAVIGYGQLTVLLIHANRTGRVIAGRSGADVAKNHVAIITSNGGYQVPATSRHLLTRVALIAFAGRNPSEP